LHLFRYYDLRWKEAINDLTENIQIENMPLDKNEGGLGVKFNIFFNSQIFNKDSTQIY